MLLVNNSIVDTAKKLLKFMLTNPNISNSGDRLWMDELSRYLSNTKPNGSYSKYSISKLKFIVGYLGPKYLLE